MTYEFLTEEWMAAAKAVREKYADRSAKVAVAIRMNQIITDVPFGEGTLNVFLDTSSGDVVMDLGAMEAPDLTVTTDYATARAIFVEQNQQVAMQAFMAGKIKVQGDMMKMMAMQTAMPSDEIAKQISAEIKDLTT